MMPGWLRIKSAAAYAGVSASTVRSWLRAGLPCSRVRGSGAPLINRDELDSFLRGFQTSGADSIDSVVEALVAEVSV